MKLDQSVSKRRHIKFRRRGITQKKNTTKTLFLGTLNSQYIRAI